MMQLTQIFQMLNNKYLDLIGNDAVDGSGSNIDIIDSSFSRFKSCKLKSSSFVNIDNSIF